MSATIKVPFIVGLKIIIMITVAADIKVAMDKMPTPLDFVLGVLAKIVNAATGKGTKGDQVDIMDLLKTKMGIEQMWYGYRKVKQGQEKPNSITNALGRQSLIWASTLYTGLIKNNKAMTDADLKAAKITATELTSGLAIPMLMGITGVSAANVAKCDVWDSAFEEQLKKKKNTLEGRKFRARRPGLLCKMLYSYNKMKKGKEQEMGKLLFPTAHKTAKVADIKTDLNNAFKNAHGTVDKKALFTFENIWSVLPTLKDEIVNQLDAADPNPTWKITGSFGISAGVAIELNPPKKKCDMAAFTLGYTAGWQIEFPSKQSEKMQLIEAKFSANAAGDAGAATYKGILYSETPLWSKNVREGTLGVSFEWDNKEKKPLAKDAASAITAFTTGMGGVITYLSTKISGAVKDAAKAQLASSVTNRVGATSLKKDLNIGDIATSNTHIIDASYDFKAGVFTGGYTSAQGIDFNMALPAGGVGGTFSQGARVGFSLDKAQSGKFIKDIYEKIFKGKEAKGAFEEGNPEESSCDGCMMTILEKLNKIKGRSACSNYADANEMATCKHVKMELEGLYMGFGFLDTTSHWYHPLKDRGSSTWQLFEPKFRQMLCTKSPPKDFGSKGNLLAPAKHKVVLDPDASSKKAYCNNACDASKPAPTAVAAKETCKKSWMGFCRMLNFCPSTLMEAVDAFKGRKKPLVPKSDVGFQEISRSTSDTNGGDKTGVAKHGPLAAINEADCDDDACDEED